MPFLYYSFVLEFLVPVPWVWIFPFGAETRSPSGNCHLFTCMSPSTLLSSILPQVELSDHLPQPVRRHVT